MPHALCLLPVRILPLHFAAVVLFFQRLALVVRLLAARECEEETGYRPAELVPLGWIWTTPGFTDERIWLFLARGLAAGRQDLQEDEALSLERRPLAEAVRLALGGGIDDGKSIVALLRAASYLGIAPAP